jgi:DNA-binding response OmpR family regulator
VAARILVAEDDARIAAFLVRGLAAEGYDVEQTRDGPSTLAAAESGEFSLVVLDRVLPGMDGIEVCRRLRADRRRTRVLMLTARDRLQDKVDGLRGGADDYMTKPFAVDELLARIEALLRRPASGQPEGCLQVGELRLDPARKAAWRGDRPLMLTPREFALLTCLMEHAGAVVSRERLLRHVWGRHREPRDKLVDVYVRYLRSKIDEGADTSLIQTIRGFGYRVSC